VPTGHWRKRVIRAEVDALWESRPVGTFRDEPCIVLDDLGDRLHIAYLGEDAALAASLGYWQVDRGVFELLTPRDEVTGLIEERLEKPLRWGPPGGPATSPSYPYHPDPVAAAPPAPAATAPPARSTEAVAPRAASGWRPGTSSASLPTWRPSRGRPTRWRRKWTARCA